GAQQAYNAIVALRQNSSKPNAPEFLRGGRQSDFDAIGKALQSGDLAGAQQAFANLQSTFTFHHWLRSLDPTGAGSATGSASGSSSVSSRSTSGGLPEIVLNLGNVSGEQITINLSNATGGGEQVSINVGNQQNPNLEQVNLNLAQGSSQQIVLNLFNTLTN